MIHFNHTAIDAVSIPKVVAEQLLAAPGACVKVYLYGLLRASAQPEQIAQELEISKEELFEALEFLEKAGLTAVEVTGGTHIVYRQKKEEKEPLDQALYQDGEFNHMLQALFSDRELSYRDYKTCYECIDVYGLPKQVLLMLIECCINASKVGNRVPIAYIKEKAKEWSKAGIVTIDLAQQRIEEEKNARGGARAILRCLKINRLPTEEEEKLYDKWEREWGFSFAAIKAATAATTKAQYPTMKYLDGVLKNLHRDGRLSEGSVKEHFLSTEQIDDKIKELLKIISAPRLTVSPEYRKKYLRWKEMGYGEEEITFAFVYASAEGRGSVEYADMLLAGWNARGLRTAEEIKRYLNERAARKRRVARMLETAGVKKAVARADEEFYERFTERYGMNEEIVLFAAQRAYGAPAPLRAMDKMLRRWSERNVTTLAQAQSEDEVFRAGFGRTQAGDTLERSYAPGELEAKIRDPLAEMMGENNE